MTDFQKLSEFQLKIGSHNSPKEGVCAMEAVAWLEGLPHSDRPICTCPVIAAFVRQINDAMLWRQRQKLIAYLPRLVGTVEPEYEEARAKYLMAQALGKVWPVILRYNDYHGYAKEFEIVRKEWEKAQNLFTCLTLTIPVIRRAANSSIVSHHRNNLKIIDHVMAGIARYPIDYGKLYEIAVLAARHECPTYDSSIVFHTYHKFYFDMLDGALAIGNPSPGFSQPTAKRVDAYRALVRA